MSNRLENAAQALAATFAGLGIRAADDPRNLELPGAFFAPSSLQFPTLAGDALTIEWDVYLVAPDNGAHVSAIGELIDKAAPILPGRTLRADAIVLANQSPDPLPAIHFTIETETE